MGVIENLDANKFPEQAKCLGMRTKVMFFYDFTTILMGTIVRDDVEAPYVTIIRLDDGRHILGTECRQHNPENP